LAYFKAKNEIYDFLASLSGGKKLATDLEEAFGEIYGKTLMRGTLVEHGKAPFDFTTSDGKRISVKTKKGWAEEWRESGAIIYVNSGLVPTHLMFVHLNDDYTADRIWLFEWDYLGKSNRLWNNALQLIPKDDEKHLVYEREERIKLRDKLVFYCPRCKETIRTEKGSRALDAVFNASITFEMGLMESKRTHYRHKHTNYDELRHQGMMEEWKQTDPDIYRTAIESYRASANNMAMELLEKDGLLEDQNADREESSER
jgi:hypothetical protein